MLPGVAGEGVLQGTRLRALGFRESEDCKPTGGIVLGAEEAVGTPRLARLSQLELVMVRQAASMHGRAPKVFTTGGFERTSVFYAGWKPKRGQRKWICLPSSERRVRVSAFKEDRIIGF